MMRDLYYGVTEQGKASKQRMDDARALLGTFRWRGAMYMAGYKVECLLKTKLMRMFNCRHLGELEEDLRSKGLLSEQSTVFTHQLELLLRLTNSIDRLRQNEQHRRLFNKVNRWIPAWVEVLETHGSCGPGSPGSTRIFTCWQAAREVM